MIGGGGEQPPPRFFQKSGFLEEIQKPRVSSFQKSGRRPRHLLLPDPDEGGATSSHQFSRNGGGLHPPFAFFF
ncbi:hypothetical protein ACOSP7_018768 [Xanthoceras sorbifolium]